MKICLNVISRQALTDQYQTHFSHYTQSTLFYDITQEKTAAGEQSRPVVIRYKSNICHICGAGIGTLEIKKNPLQCAGY